MAQEQTITTPRQAAGLLNVSPSTISRWRAKDMLGAPPWTAAELWAVKNRPRAPRRRQGITSRHGTRSRSGSGCRCDRCQAASAAYQREWERRKAEKRLPPNVRAELITRLSRGELLATAARALHITTNQIWGRARRDLEWAELLQTTLDQARPSDLRHGVQSGFNRGCRCTECREAIRRANQNRRAKGNTPHSGNQAPPGQLAQASVG